MLDEDISAFFEGEEKPVRKVSRRAKTRAYKLKQRYRSAEELFRTKHDGRFDESTNTVVPVPYRHYYENVAYFKRKAHKTVRRFHGRDEDGFEMPIPEGAAYRKLYDYWWNIT